MPGVRPEARPLGERHLDLALVALGGVRAELGGEHPQVEHVGQLAARAREPEGAQVGLDHQHDHGRVGARLAEGEIGDAQRDGAELVGRFRGAVDRVDAVAEPRRRGAARGRRAGPEAAGVVAASRPHRDVGPRHLHVEPPESAGLGVLVRLEAEQVVDARLGADPLQAAAEVVLVADREAAGALRDLGGAFRAERDLGVGGADVARIEAAAGLLRLRVGGARDQPARVDEVDRDVGPARRVDRALRLDALLIGDEARRQHHHRLAAAHRGEAVDGPLERLQRRDVAGRGLLVDGGRAHQDVLRDDADLAAAVLRLEALVGRQVGRLAAVDPGVLPAAIDLVGDLLRR